MVWNYAHSKAVNNIFRWPCFTKWGPVNGRWTWSFGWWTGPDNDLICIKPHCINYSQSHVTLSPVAKNAVCAFISFLLKRLLYKLDENMYSTFDLYYTEENLAKRKEEAQRQKEANQNVSL